MRKAYIGTSGFHYSYWQKVFYPQGMPASSWLSFYAEHFAATEINNTFYQIPRPEVIKQWRSQTPATFIFAVKANRQITHTRKLNEAAVPVWKTFTKALTHFGSQLGPILIQLPPGWGANADRLDSFLRKAKPPKTSAHARLVFEFRDPGWFCDDVYAVLRKHKAGLVFADMPGATTPRVLTTDIVYFRLHGSKGLYGSKYTQREIKALARDITSLRRGHTLYAFFDNDSYGYAPTNAQELITQL